MNARLSLLIAAWILALVPAIAEPLPLRSSWIQKNMLKIQRPLIVPVPRATSTESEYHAGDTVEVSGRVTAYQTRSAHGMLTGCHGFIRRDDGKFVP
jgi:hypothetical protein